MSNDGALDAAARGEHRAGQVCPIFGIKRESLFIQLVAIDNQDSFVGNNIIFGSPRGQRPSVIFAFGGDAAGQETIAAGSYSLQGGSGQQSLVPVQLHLSARRFRALERPSRAQFFRVGSFLFRRPLPNTPGKAQLHIFGIRFFALVIPQPAGKVHCFLRHFSSGTAQILHKKASPGWERLFLV